MKVLYLVNHLNVGGITSYILTLARGMKKRGHDVYIASSGGGLLGKFQESGINFIFIPIKTKKELNPKIIYSALKLKKLIKRETINLVHSNSRTTQVLGCLLKRISGARHISTCHGFFKRRLLRRIFPCWGDKVIAISEAVEEHLIRDFKVNEDRIRIIHNGIDAGSFTQQSSVLKQEARKSFGLAEGPLVGIVARLSDVKGHRYLIEAVSKIAADFPDIKLLIIGEGKTEAALTRLAAELGIKEKVIILPSVPENARILQAMDIFVMPSLQEGLGLALMEAMASGLAVIGSNVGGIRNLINNGVNGILVEPRDSAGLADAMRDLLLDEKKRQALGKQARDFIVSNFSDTEMVFKTEEVYSECVSA